MSTRKRTSKLQCGHPFIGQSRCGRCDRCWTCCNCADKLTRGKDRVEYVKATYLGPGIRKAKERYTRWWVGKRCRIYDTSPFRLVTAVELQGPPSFVYGSAWLIFDNGDRELVQTGHRNRYVPTKDCVEVEIEKEHYAEN